MTFYLVFSFLAAVCSAQRDYNSGAWRSSLSGPDTCWTDPTCRRAMDGNKYQYLLFGLNCIMYVHSVSWR